MNINYSKEQLALQGKLEAANINPESFLATDYLNHFNEIVMLFEMVPDMPDMLEDCYEWSPKDYCDHFMDSGFAAKELAVEAYEKCPAPVRAAFDAVISELNSLIESTLNGLRAVGAHERGFTPQSRLLLEARTIEMQACLGKMNRLIHAKFDENLIKQTHYELENIQSQDDIDALFD